MSIHLLKFWMELTGPVVPYHFLGITYRSWVLFANVLAFLLLMATFAVGHRKMFRIAQQWRPAVYPPRRTMGFWGVLTMLQIGFLGYSIANPSNPLLKGIDLWFVIGSFAGIVGLLSFNREAFLANTLASHCSLFAFTSALRGLEKSMMVHKSEDPRIQFLDFFLISGYFSAHMAWLRFLLIPSWTRTLESIFGTSLILTRITTAFPLLLLPHLLMEAFGGSAPPPLIIPMVLWWPLRAWRCAIESNKLSDLTNHRIRGLLLFSLRIASTASAMCTLYALFFRFRPTV